MRGKNYIGGAGMSNTKLVRLTQKKFIQELEESKGFLITSIFGIGIEEVVKKLDIISEERAISNAIYKGVYVKKPSYLVAYMDNGETSKRYFNGYNRYFKYGNYILHEVRETKESKPIVMINL